MYPPLRSGAYSFEEEDGAPAEQGMDACKVPQDAYG